MLRVSKSDCHSQNDYDYLFGAVGVVWLGRFLHLVRSLWCASALQSWGFRSTLGLGDEVQNGHRRPDATEGPRTRVCVHHHKNNLRNCYTSVMALTLVITSSSKSIKITINAITKYATLDGSVSAVSKQKSAIPQRSSICSCPESMC